MKRCRYLFRNLGCILMCIALGGACTKRTTTTKPVTGIYGANPKFFSNFKAKSDGTGMMMVDRNGKEISSEFRMANKEFRGGKSFAGKSYGTKEFNTKEFNTKEFGRESYTFDGERNVHMKESTLGNERFEGADKVADTNKTLHDRSKEVARTPFADANKSAQGRPYREAEKAQQEGDGKYKGVVQSYERNGDPITFSDIKSMLNR